MISKSPYSKINYVWLSLPESQGYPYVHFTSIKNSSYTSVSTCSTALKLFSPTLYSCCFYCIRETLYVASLNLGQKQKEKQNERESLRQIDLTFDILAHCCTFSGQRPWTLSQLIVLYVYRCRHISVTAHFFFFSFPSCLSLTGAHQLLSSILSNFITLFLLLIVNICSLAVSISQKYVTFYKLRKGEDFL